MSHRRSPAVLAGALLTLCAVTARAGSLDAPAAPDNAGSALYTIADVYNRINNGSTAGQWRLPNIKELQSLIDFGQLDPALPAGHPFTGVQSSGEIGEESRYWSSTTRAGFNNTYFAWNLVLYDGEGSVWNGNKDLENYVWPVRYQRRGTNPGGLRTSISSSPMARTTKPRRLA